MTKSADKFFDDVNFASIISTIKGVFMSDGAMSTLLDFERVLDEADLYAFKNWELGELVQGPESGRYTVKCIFMWPYKLMPDPSGAKRLAGIGCNITYGKSVIKVPVKVEAPDDFVAGTHYPKMVEKKVWFVQIEVPRELMNDIKEGSIDLADQTIELDELDQAYEEDLDKDDGQANDEEAPQDQQMDPALGQMPQSPAPGQPPAM